MVQKKIESETVVEIEDAQYDDITLSELSDDEEIANIIKEIGADTTKKDYEMRVYRIPTSGRRLSWLFDCDPTVSVYERLRDEYGGGHFELRVYCGSQIFRRPRIQIEAPKNRVPTTPASKSEVLNKIDVLDLITQSQEKFFDRISKMVAPPSQVTAVNPITQMAEMITLMSSMRDFNGDITPKTNAIEQIKEVLELKKLLGGGSDSETSGSDVIIAAIEHLGGPFAELVQQQQTETQVAPSARPARTVPIKKEMSKDMLALQLGLKMMVSAARSNEDPAPYVDIIFNKLSLENIQLYLMSNDAIDKLSKINPSVVNHRPWFEELRGLVVERVNEEIKAHSENLDAQNKVAS